MLKSLGFQTEQIKQLKILEREGKNVLSLDELTHPEKKCIVHLAHNGEVAINKSEARIKAGRPFDYIILDRELGGGSEYEGPSVAFYIRRAEFKAGLVQSQQSIIFSNTTTDPDYGYYKKSPVLDGSMPKASREFLKELLFCLDEDRLITEDGLLPSDFESDLLPSNDSLKSP